MIIVPDAEWRDIPGFPAYAVTVDGRVFSRNDPARHVITDHFQRQLKPFVNKDGYHMVTLNSKAPGWCAPLGFADICRGMSDGYGSVPQRRKSF